MSVSIHKSYPSCHINVCLSYQIKILSYTNDQIDSTVTNLTKSFINFIAHLVNLLHYITFFTFTLIMNISDILLHNINKRLYYFHKETLIILNNIFSVRLKLITHRRYNLIIANDPSTHVNVRERAYCAVNPLFFIRQ